MNGNNIFFRQINTSDKERLQEGLHLLSNESIYTRFFSSVRDFSEKQLNYLTNIDQKDHVGWGASCPSYPKLPGLGVCRFVRSADDPKIAEFAITVIDGFQNKGIGTEFLALLYVLAPYHGIEYLSGSALNANAALIKRFEQLGATTSWNSGECDLIIPVFKDVKEIPDNNYTKIFRNLLIKFSSYLSI